MPTQKRSRERVERMLSAATALIEKAGSDAMKMSEVAERAGVSIGSLYQYFPDKTAIIATLAERYNAMSCHCIGQGLAGVQSMAALRDAFSDLIDTYYAMFLAEPVMRDIWSGTQADKALCAMELEQGRVLGKMLADVVIRLKPAAEADDVATKAFLVMHLGEATMRLAIATERKEGQAIVDAYKQMVLADLLAD
ncbi:TetR/AcrR family transcriptional regulator [Mesorhizobium xinjiangense]|uniref:TetR/AcrR family transcriptional regulator n=1 Tax=Mesorhizobium xinjiangense TaxID=2678685 RepID=UPI001F326A43|nr:TetR/AcrR family transcriptional regulator [Mesorhizobium xinjiangense]